MTNSVTQYLVNTLTRDKLIITGLGKTIEKAGYAVLEEGEHLHDEVVQLIKAGVAKLTTEKPAIDAAVAAAGVQISKPFQGMTEAELKADANKAKADVAVDMTAARADLAHVVTKIGAGVDETVTAEEHKVEDAVKADVAAAPAATVAAVEAAAVDVATDVVDAAAKSKKAAK